MIHKIKKNKKSLAFTIVELLIVIVIIGILAAITIVSYTGISKKATDATFISDLSNAKKQFALYYVDHGVYPTSLDSNECPINASVVPNDTKYCLKSGPGNDFSITDGTGSSYTLVATKGATKYSITNDSAPIAVVTPTNCPTGFVLVPGSTTYGTSSFCVMKYEAKNAGGNIPVSTMTGVPWNSVSPNDAITYSQNVAGCAGCHLITEAEWMTIAQNIASQPGNWSGNVVGSGYLYKGHSDQSSAAQPASTDDNGYYGTGQTSGDQRRTFYLSNGNVLWDISGNLCDLTSGRVSSGQPGVIGNNYSTWYEWNAINSAGTLPVNPSPAGTGIVGAGSWTSVNNVGMLLSNPTDTVTHGFARGGYYFSTTYAGLFALDFGNAILDGGYGFFGFRVAAPPF